jgi:hypothetical protein
MKQRTLVSCDYCPHEAERRKPIDTYGFVFHSGWWLPEGWILIADGAEDKLVCAAHKIIIE